MQNLHEKRKTILFLEIFCVKKKKFLCKNIFCIFFRKIFLEKSFVIFSLLFFKWKKFFLKQTKEFHSTHRIVLINFKSMNVQIWTFNSKLLDIIIFKKSSKKFFPNSARFPSKKKNCPKRKITVRLYWETILKESCFLW